MEKLMKLHKFIHILAISWLYCYLNSQYSDISEISKLYIEQIISFMCSYCNWPVWLSTNRFSPYQIIIMNILFESSVFCFSWQHLLEFTKLRKLIDTRKAKLLWKPRQQTCGAIEIEITTNSRLSYLKIWN